jgi:hypothetical protein
MNEASSGLPRRAGVGLKPEHFGPLLDAAQGACPLWLEVHPQNYFGAGGPPHRWLEALAGRYPLSFHSTGLSLGSADGVDARQLDMLADLVDRYAPAMVSDHLSWSAVGDGAVPDLLPLPYTDEALDCMMAAVDAVQTRLRRPILIENPSRYLAFAADRYEEAGFLHRLCRGTGCGILLDVNNLFVTAENLGFDAAAAIDAVDPGLVQEIHLAGHARESHDGRDLLLDNHGGRVCDAVWALYRRFIDRAGPRPTLIEWDVFIPDFDTLASEARAADQILCEEPAGARVAA